MGDVLRAAGGAVRREGAVDEEFLLFYPKVYHRFGQERAGRPTPDILALKRLSRDIRRMFELSGGRQVIGPCLGAAGEIVVPLQSGYARQRTLAIVGFEEAGIQIAQARLHARQQQR